MPHRPDIHRWYCTAGWQRRRAHQLMIEPLCRLCLEAGRVTPATVADHVEPHRGDLTRSSSVRSAACAPTATMGSTGIMPRAHRSARTAPLPTRTIRGTRARRGRPSTPAAYCGEVVSRAAGAGIKRLEAAEHRPRPAGGDFKRDATRTRPHQMGKAKAHGCFSTPKISSSITSRGTNHSEGSRGNSRVAPTTDSLAGGAPIGPASPSPERGERSPSQEWRQQPKQDRSRAPSPSFRAARRPGYLT